MEQRDIREGHQSSNTERKMCQCTVFDVCSQEESWKQINRANMLLLEHHIINFRGGLHIPKCVFVFVFCKSKYEIKCCDNRNVYLDGWRDVGGDFNSVYMNEFVVLMPLFLIYFQFFSF